MDAVNPPKKSPDKSLIWLIIIVTIALIVAFLWWWNYRKYITTDDANLDSYRVNVAARVMAPIAALHVWEGDTVKQGELLAELDSSNITASLHEAIARREEMAANLELNRVNLATSKNNLKLAEIALQQSTLNYQRARTQFSGQAISEEAFQNMDEAHKSAQVKVEVARNQITAVQAQMTATEASIAAADAGIASVRTELSYYRIVAPTDGVIGKRWSLPGDITQPGQTIYTLNEGKDIWVSVYLEETKFQNIYVGQPAEFTLDAYAGLTFSGKIFYIGSNAASEFALIPPNNASGNYTKVAQRVPLKISIDKVEGPEKEKAKVKLISGMSANVEIVKEKR